MTGQLPEGVTYDAATLRAVADALEVSGNKYLELAERAGKAAGEACQDAAAFKPPHDPAPVYDTTVAALSATSDKYRDETKALGDTLIADAGALRDLAAGLESGEGAASDQFNKINPDGNPPAPVYTI